MFATGNDDEFNTIGGFKKISSIIGNSLMILWFIGTFCTNFLSHQLETWQMLADNDNNNNSIQMKSSSNHQTRQNFQRQKEHNERVHIATKPNSSAPEAQRSGGRGRGGGGKRSSKDCSNKLINTMRTGSIDDSQQASVLTCPAHGHSGRIWRRPEYSIATAEVAASSIDVRNQLNNPIRFEPSRSCGGVGLPSIAGGIDQIPSHSFSNPKHCNPYQRQNSPSRFSRRGVQGPTAINLWYQASMDEQSEYLTSRHLSSDLSSPPSASSPSAAAAAAANNNNNYQIASSSNYRSCHRTRNASYSSYSTRIPPINNTISSMQPSSTEFGVNYFHHQQHPASLLSTQNNSGLLSHCSPSSSGSLPAGLQLGNRHSCSGSFDVSLEEPTSLPLMNPADRKAAVQQAMISNVVHTHGHPRLDQRAAGGQIYGQPMAADTMGGYRWRHDLGDTTMSSNQCGQAGLRQIKGGNKTVLVGRQIFKHSIYSHPNAVGSDSELYSHKQQIDRRKDEMMIPFNNNNNTNISKPNRPQLIGQSSIAASDHTPDRRALRHRNTNDALRLNSRQAETFLNLQGANTTTEHTRQHTTDIKFKANSDSSGNRLSLAGTIRRLGFKQKGLLSLSVQRSEEVVPRTENCNTFSRFGASSSFADSRNDCGRLYWIGQQQQQQPQQRIGSESIDPRADFVEGLGPGQIASRQALVSPYLGDIQLTLNDRRGMLEVEIVRARGLQLKAGTKSLPCPYVKLYLMKNKKCLAKSKTSPARRTLDPLYQQQFIFREEYTNCILQLIVWGDYGKKDRKSLMGIVQIRIDDLDISNLVIGWYRMFNAPSMTDSLVSSKNLRHQLLSKTVDID